MKPRHTQFIIIGPEASTRASKLHARPFARRDRVPLHPTARSGGNTRDDIDTVEVRMLRSENLTIEIFIDEDDDGIMYAETLMFTTRFRRLLARGYARVEPRNADVCRISDERIAAVALLDLVRTLNHDESGDNDENSGSSQLDR
jgi:Rv2632c-like